MEIFYLNHASIIIKEGDIRLLTDPWFWGTCFEEGWGLQYNNPDALDKAKECTHIWVSHFHQDHFHKPTLQMLLEVNPSINFIGNNSYNFQLDEAAANIGFSNITSLYERKPLALGDNFTVTRYPTTGIDNMLVIRTSKEVILNYNDCNISIRSQKMLKKKIGHIDCLLTNFNHAGKLLLYPFPDPDVIKQKLIKSFSENYTVFNPDYVLPFASYHFYRAPESFNQNKAMLTADDLVHLDKKIINWKIGHKFILRNGKASMTTESNPFRNTQDQLEHKKKYTLEQLKVVSVLFANTLKKRFGFFSYFFPTFYIEVTDTGTLLGFKSAKGCFPAKETIKPHIKAHSESLYNWFSKPYGTDSFVVGAHFDIVNEKRLPLKWKIVIGLLADNKLDLRSLIGMLFRKDGIKFLWNRREEIWGILLSFKLAASYHED